MEFHLGLRYCVTYILEFVYKMEVLTVVTLRNTVFWDVMLYISLEAFAATEFSKIFSTIWPNKGVESFPSFQGLTPSPSSGCC